MTQQMLSTRPNAAPGEPADESPPHGAGAPAQRPRRRLGSWQLGTPENAAAPIDLPRPPHSLDDSTVPLRTGDQERQASTMGLGTRTAPLPDAARANGAAAAAARGEVTVPLGAPGNGTATGPDATIDLQPSAPEAFTSPISPIADQLPTSALARVQSTQAIEAATAPIAGAVTVTTADLLRTIRLRGVGADADPTAALPSDQTAATARITAPATAPIDGAPDQTVDLTTPLSAEDEARLTALRERAAANPADSDALFELVVALHRAGEKREARSALTKLVRLYEERGQHTQAARIQSMLSAPKTGPIATEDLPPRPTAATPTVPLQRRTASLAGQATAPIAARTARLQSRLLTAPAVPDFPPESLTFTMPLPGEQHLPAEVRELIAQSTEDLRRGKLNAAYDLCLYALNLAPDYVPIYLRIAEIYTAQRLTRRARTQGETLLRLLNATGNREHLWMIYRVLLHTSGHNLPNLRQLVELLIEAGQTEQASLYASKLIQLLDAEGLTEEAAAYSERLCGLIPGDTRAALESVVLILKHGDRGRAVDRWEAAVAAGADPGVAKSSMAAIMTAINEDDHWRMVSEVVTALRGGAPKELLDAYIRTAAVETPTTILQAGEGLLLAAADDNRARDLLAGVAGDRAGSPFARAVSAVALAWLEKASGPSDEYVAAIRTATKLLEMPSVAAHPAWSGLVGRVPRFEDLSLELGEALLARQDAAGAAEVLKVAHGRTNHHGPISDRLAEAYFRIGQLGSALTVLDEMAVHYRNTGQLESMAGVLRQMSQLAPNNIKVKSRLIDAYLQRGFVAEARAELIQRADLEERSGLIKDAISSLQRAADLSWTMGLADETFALYHRMVALAPMDAGNRHALVNLYLQMGRLDEAAANQRAVVDIAMQQDSKHEAIAALHQVIGLTPDDTSAYYQLGDLLTSIGEYSQAEKVYRRLVLMNPSDAIAQAKATTMAALKESMRPS